MTSSRRMQVFLCNAILLFIFVLVSNAQIYRNECRRDAIMKVTDRDKKLTGVILEARASSLPHCVRGCIHESMCSSINYKKVTNTMQENNCELLNTNRTSEGANLISAPGWLHYEPTVQVSPRCRFVTCNPGYECIDTCEVQIGYKCIDINECASNPCQHGATCNNEVNRYTCTCVPGYEATNCQIDTNECSSNPCQHGGTCNDQVSKYNCTCAPGYEGTNCQTDTNECASNPCQHGGTCSDHVNQYTCTCAPGYEGTNCQTDINECASNPCLFGGTCNDQVNQYTCTCAPGYEGTNCQTDTNECASLPCQNGGSCSDRVNRYTCSCVPGYQGTNCQTDINECSSSPCRNGGACNDHVNSYTCTCSQEYFGTHCEIVNAARGRATAQSSTFEAAYPGKAVDGNRDTNYWHGSCSHTHDEASAWWRVDLGRQYTIGTIRITNRASSWNRLSNFDVNVGRSVSSYYSCYYFPGTVGSSATVTLTCTSIRTGRYVRVRLRSTNFLQLCEVQVFPRQYTSCKEIRMATGTSLNEVYELWDLSKTSHYPAYCNMEYGGWTLIARFSNADAKNWIATSGSYWYDQTAVGSTTSPSANSDMINKAFSNAKGTDIKLTRSDTSSHHHLLYSAGCLSSTTFRSKITSYGNFRNNARWSSGNRCLGQCSVNSYWSVSGVSGFSQYNCNGNIQSANQIGFWCHYSSGDGAVIMIGGGGSSCARADHGIAITEENDARFGTIGPMDFGDNAAGSSSYALNLWIR